jgi:hypothetical protein
MKPSAFQLSRIYGQGWNAAKQLLGDNSHRPDPKQAAALNPYQALEERARWSQGFEEGLLSRTGGRRTANHRSRCPDGDSMGARARIGAAVRWSRSSS